jgi:uncharacterized protein YbcI
MFTVFTPLDRGSAGALESKSVVRSSAPSSLRCIVLEGAREASMAGVTPLAEDAVERRVSKAVERLYLDRFGKGPLYTLTSIRGDVIVTVMRDVLTPAEKALAGSGRGDSVLTTRMLWQHATDVLFKAAVGGAVGRKVLVAISGFELDHDMASETFILAPAGV